MVPACVLGGCIHTPDHRVGRKRLLRTRESGGKRAWPPADRIVSGHRLGEFGQNPRICYLMNSLAILSSL